MDDQQDWELQNGYENATHTVFQFSRKFDTCDHQDFAITVSSLKSHIFCYLSLLLN